MPATLYGVPASHPVYAAELMLRRKGVAYRRVDLPPWFHRALLRLLRFPGITVPALVLDGRRVQTTKAIARELGLEPADPQVAEIESWCDAELQQMGRRLIYWSLRRHTDATTSYLEGAHLILPRPAVTPLAPVIVRIMARDHKARDEAVRQDLAALPGLLDRIDGWIGDGVLGGDEPNVADYQVATSLALLMTLDDLRPVIEARPAGRLVARLAPDLPGRVPPAFPPAWLG